MQVSALYRYPVKSLGGQSVTKARVEPIGLVDDRRWMVVNEAGRFMTRRELPSMAQIEALPTPDGIVLRNKVVGDLAVRFPAAEGPVRTVHIWRDEVKALAAEKEADAWLSAFFGRELHLVHQREESRRPITPEFGQPGDSVSFADGFPILLTTTESLAALNEQLHRPATMERFRPNIVLSGASESWAEDRWRKIRIGGITMRIVKPCTRCVITMQDPTTGYNIDGNELLATLRAMGRRTPDGVIFGQNAIPDGAGDIAVGDDVEILDSGESNLANI